MVRVRRRPPSPEEIEQLCLHHLGIDNTGMMQKEMSGREVEHALPNKGPIFEC